MNGVRSRSEAREGSREEVMNIFDCAIKIEEETIEYYEGLMAESRDPQMKSLFSLVAASMAQHRDNLLKLKAMSQQQQVDLQLDGAVCSFKPLLSQRELLEAAKNDPDLYQFAVREEESEIRLYEKLASLTGDSATGTALMMLAEEERRELDTVESIYAYVEEPMTYLESAEFSNRKEL
jgi:rubrerythrin